MSLAAFVAQSKTLKKQIIQWLEIAEDAPKASSSFGDNIWANFQGGGTSRAPYCRPQGVKNKQGRYSAQLFLLNYDPGKGAAIKDTQAITAVDFGDKEPTKDEVYDKFIEMLQE